MLRWTPKIRKIAIFLAIMASICPIFSAGLSAPAMPNQQIWNLKNADIRAIIRTVSMITGKTFIIDPRVQGKVTFVSQHPMSVNELYNAFLSMLQILNYVAVPAGKVIKIVPSIDANSMGGQLTTGRHPGKGDALVVRIIPINHVSATELVPVLRPLMPQWANITAYHPSNTLILAGTASNIHRLAALVKTMDSQSANATVMVSLKNASANTVVNLLNQLQTSNRLIGKSANVSLVADNSSNSILISGNLNNIARTKALIRELDNKSKSSGSDTKVIFLNYLSAKKLAPILAKIAAGSLKATLPATGAPMVTLNHHAKTAVTMPNTVSIQAEPDTDNAIIIRAPHKLMLELTHIIKRLDKEPQQVLVEAIIVKIDENLLDQLGIVWGTVNASTGNSTVVNPDDPNAVTNNVSETSTSPANTFALKISHGIGFIANGSLQALIHALKSDGSTDILSTPSIVVLNNQKATISDGQNVGLVNREYQSSNVQGSGNQNLGTPFNTIERKDVTLSLTVTPRISPNQNLRLAITQEDDSLAQASTADASQDNPVIDTSKITTNVLVHSGDILVLGGLVDHAAKKTVSKVPILGDIPLLGHLFRYTNKNLEKKDLMVFLKPLILSNREVRESQTLQRYRYARKQQFLARQNKPLSGAAMPLLPSSATLYRHPFLPLPRQTRPPKEAHE